MEELLRVEGLVRHYRLRRTLSARGPDVVRAVDGVSIRVRRGETLGIVGESGSGKSTLARCIAGLDEVTAGTVLFRGDDVLRMRGTRLRRLRRHLQFIFQDPYASLNPRKTVAQILGDPFAIHGAVPRAGRRERVVSLVERVGLRAEHLDRYPHQFSGGQRQRVAIARAIALEPELIIADEPVSALDVSIQAQIINLLVELQRDMNLTYVFISHDLRVVRYFADRVAVMYRGRIVEAGRSDQVFGRPRHPYTAALLAAVPSLSPAARGDRTTLRRGDGADPPAGAGGCLFRARCPRARPECAAMDPRPAEAPDGHAVLCHCPIR